MRRAVVALALAGCSLGVPQPDACESSDECRTTFGPAFYCDTSSGLCESVVTDACPELFPADADGDDAILFGTIFDRSSPNQLAREKSARLAVTGLNSAGGIDGRTVALLNCDAAGGAAPDVADHLVDIGVPAIIGPSSSQDTQAVFSAHAMDGVLVISPSATATQLGGIDGSMPGRLWRTAPPDTLQSRVILGDLVAQGIATFAIVRAPSTDVYAQSLGIILEQDAMMTAGIDHQTTAPFADAASILSAAMSAVAGAPDAVVFISARVGDAAAFLDAVDGVAEYDGVTIFFPDAAANEDLFTLTGAGTSRFPQVRATRPAAPDTIITSEFVRDYMTANGGEDPLDFSFTAHTYDATALVLLGAGYALGAGTLDGTSIAEGIKRMTSGTMEQNLVAAQFTAIIAQLRGAGDVDVVGASGQLDYDATTEELTSATYEVLTIGGTDFVAESTVTVP